MEAERLTVPEVARRMGISSVAVRKRVKCGTLRAVKADGLWHVELPGGPSATLPGLDAGGEAARSDGPSGSPSQQTAHSDRPADGLVVAELAIALHEALALLGAERERAGTAEQAAVMWQERARNLEAENGRPHELLALPAQEEEPPRRRWWAFWRRDAQSPHPAG